MAFQQDTSEQGYSPGPSLCSQKGLENNQSKANWKCAYIPGAAYTFTPANLPDPPFLFFCECLVPRPCILTVASFPGQLPIACSMVKRQRAWYIFSREWRHGQGKLRERGWHVNHKKPWPARMHWSKTIQVERRQHTKALLCRSSWDSRSVG